MRVTIRRVGFAIAASALVALAPALLLAQAQLPQKMYKLELTGPQIDQLYSALAKQPYGDVVGLINAVTGQVMQANIGPPPAPPPPAATKPADGATKPIEPPGAKPPEPPIKP